MESTENDLKRQAEPCQEEPPVKQPKLAEETKDAGEKSDVDGTTVSEPGERVEQDV